jgi:hypothetical protein
VVPQIARDHDLGANLVKRWVREHHMRSLSKEIVPVEVVALAAPIGDILLISLAGSNGSWWLGPTPLTMLSSNLIIRSHNGGQLRMSNTPKYLSYKLAHEKITRALAEGYPLEAIAICESMITDRLLSYANYHGGKLDPTKATLGQVIKRIRKLVTDLAATDPLGDDLLEKASGWAASRNHALHAIAKSGQGQGPKISAAEFDEFAMATAQDGNRLLKQIKSWHQKQVRQAARSSA